MTLWSIPKTWTSVLVSVADLNQYLRDEFLAISSIPKARVYASAGPQGIADITPTTVSFDSERYDTDAIHAASPNPDRLVCKTAGVYTIGANIGFGADPNGTRIVTLVVNGTDVVAYDDRPANDVGGEPTVINISSEWVLAVNDYVTVTVYQSSGGSLSLVNQAAWSPEFWMHRISE